MDENKISHAIIGAAIEVHRELGGPGLLESIYEECLVEELLLRGLPVERQVNVPIYYKGRQLTKTYTIDLLVGGSVIVELKAIDALHGIHSAQLLTQLRVTEKRLGLLVNFGQKYVKDGIQRVVNNL